MTFLSVSLTSNYYFNCLVYASIYFFIICIPPDEIKTSWKQGPYLSYSCSLSSQQLERCWAHSSCSINICWLNEGILHPNSGVHSLHISKVKCICRSIPVCEPPSQENCTSRREPTILRWEVLTVVCSWFWALGPICPLPPSSPHTVLSLPLALTLWHLP